MITLTAILIKFQDKLKSHHYFLQYSLCFVLTINNILTVNSQTTIPSFQAVDLNDVVIDFPADVKGKKTLIAFAFSQKAQEDLESWIEPVYYEFIDKESLASLVYDVNIYLVIVFNKVNSSFKQKVRNELKENVLKEFYGKIVLCEEGSGYILSGLEESNSDVPTLYALNENGEIKETVIGRYTEKKMEIISSKLEIE